MSAIMDEQFLRTTVKNTIDKKYHGEMSKEYMRRLEMEMRMITEMGLIRYHIMMAEVVKYTKLLGYVPEEYMDDISDNLEELERMILKSKWECKRMTMGIGKGKVCGSLLCYVLGITDVDPMKYGLRFEQYLNNQNGIVSFEVYLDMAPSIVGRIINYVEKKYGKEKIIVRTNDERPSFAIKCCTDESNVELSIVFELFDTLDYINEAIRTKDLSLRPDDIRNLTFSNDMIYRNIFATGKTGQVFLFNQQDVKNVAMEFEPKSINDLAVILSVTRPGVEVNLEKIVENRREANIEYIIPELEPILRETYGTIVFREQIVEICILIAGFTMYDAELMCRNMCKKSNYEGNKKVFIASCDKRGIKTSTAELLYDMLYNSAPLTLIKSYAIPYAMYSYITAWIERKREVINSKCN